MTDSAPEPLGKDSNSRSGSEDFRLFLSYFPEVTLPVTLTFDSRRAFGADMPPLPELLAAPFFFRWEEEVPDPWTEFLPGFQVRMGKFQALVYWKAALLHYAYVMVIVDAQGGLIDRMLLAETIAGQDEIRQGAALIREDGMILMAESAQDIHDPLGDPRQTITERWRLDPEGRFVEAQESPTR